MKATQFSHRCTEQTTHLIGVDDAVEVGVGHAVAGQLEVALHVGLLGVSAVDGVQLVERRLRAKQKQKRKLSEIQPLPGVNKKKKERRKWSHTRQHVGKLKKKNYSYVVRVAGWVLLSRTTRTTYFSVFLLGFCTCPTSAVWVRVRNGD